MFAQRLGCLTYLTLAGQEDQHIARSGAMRFVHRIDDGRIEVAVLLLLPGPITSLDRVEPPRDFDHRRRFAIHGEMPAEALGIECRRGHDNLQIGPLRQKLLEIAEHEIDIQAALVRLVDEDRVVLTQERIGLRFGEQDAVGHQLDVAVGCDAVGEADLEADMTAEFRFQLLRDARRRGACGYPARLGVTDLAIEAAADFKADLGQLRGLARTGLAADHHHLMTADRLAYFDAPHIHRQGFVIGQHRQACPACLGIELHCASLWTVKIPSPVINSEPKRCVAAATAAQP